MGEVAPEPEVGSYLPTRDLQELGQAQQRTGHTYGKGFRGW